MAGSIDIAREKKGFGAAADNGSSGTDWQKMMSMFALANNSNPQTMLGFALGKLLHNAFDKWKSSDDTGWTPPSGSTGSAESTASGSAPLQTGLMPGTDWSQSAAERYGNKMIADALGNAGNKEWSFNVATNGGDVGNGLSGLMQVMQKKEPPGETTTAAYETLRNPMSSVDPNSALGKYMSAQQPTDAQTLGQLAQLFQHDKKGSGFSNYKLWQS